MIQSFSCSDTERFYKLGRAPRKSGWQAVKNVAARKLDMIDAAAVLTDLKVPPNNKLEVLKGDLQGYYSIRINDQWRIIFKWANNNAYDVRICDYH
jgi:proteic killer suppression protein